MCHSFVQSLAKLLISLGINSNFLISPAPQLLAKTLHTSAAAVLGMVLLLACTNPNLGNGSQLSPRKSLCSFLAFRFLLKCPFSRETSSEHLKPASFFFMPPHTSFNATVLVFFRTLFLLPYMTYAFIPLGI